MENLTKRTPAENYLLLNGNQASLKDLLKFTIVDLLSRGILTSNKKKLKFNPHALSIDTNIYLSDEGATYTPKPHETPILNIFLPAGQGVTKMLFRHLVKISYENSKPRKHFVFNLLVKNEGMDNYINTSLFSKIFNTVKLTSSGKALSKDLEEEVRKLVWKIPRSINSNPEEAKEIVERLQGNIYLLEKSFGAKTLKKIEKAFPKKRKPRETVDHSGCFVYFPSYTSDFDSGYSSTSDSSGSGCGGIFDSSSGDSGCSSGCSGCGGCGGCGG